MDPVIEKAPSGLIPPKSVTTANQIAFEHWIGERRYYFFYDDIREGESPWSVIMRHQFRYAERQIAILRFDPKTRELTNWPDRFDKFGDFKLEVWTALCELLSLS